jgi:hypothetical protein
MWIRRVVSRALHTSEAGSARRDFSRSTGLGIFFAGLPVIAIAYSSEKKSTLPPHFL